MLTRGVFMLAEEVATGPTITTGGTLTAFSSNPGVPSAAQTYAVSGTNLTDAIVITPPAAFEISLTSGSGWFSNPNTISLTPSGDTLTNTTIYVRFNRFTAGTSTGNITHTSSGVAQKTWRSVAPRAILRSRRPGCSPFSSATRLRLPSKASLYPAVTSVGMSW